MNDLPIMRVARPTDNLKIISKMYMDGLKMSLVGAFTDHDGFSGVIIGNSGCPYHLEFTTKEGHTAGIAPTQDNLLVFYLPNPEAWQKCCQNMISAGFRPVDSFNPYWDNTGKTFEDCDRYRVVIQNSNWPV